METGKIEFAWPDLNPLELPKTDAPSTGAGSVVVLPHPPPPPDDPQSAPFLPPNWQESFDRLVRFCQERGASAELSPLTNLPAYLIGNLQDPQTGPPEQALAGFLNEHIGLFTGLRPEEVRLRLDTRAAWPDGTHQVHFAQTNAQQVPVFGSRISGSLDASGRLTLVHNNLFPAQPAQIDSLTWGNPEELLGREFDLEGKPGEDSPLLLLTPPLWVAGKEISGATPSQDWPRFIFPYADGEGQGVYRPAWEVLLVDAAGTTWMAMVDAENGRLLGLTATDQYAVIQADVYLSAGDALSSRVTPRQLDLGAASARLANANRVTMEGARFVDLPTAPGAAVPDPLSATLYYHIYAAQDRFSGRLTNASILVSNPGSSPMRKIGVVLPNAEGAPRYNWVEKKIYFHCGDPRASSLIREPGYDPEVVYHEFTHAMVRFLNSNLYVYPNLRYAQIEQMETITDGLNEGLAYYFGCSFASSDARYANYAYPDPPWTNFDLASAAGDVPTVRAGIMDIRHTKGMWWARVLWQLEKELGAIRVNRIALKALVNLSGPISSESSYATGLFDAAANCQEKNAILDCFRSVNMNLPYQCS